MKSRIKVCQRCRLYTLKERCPKCGLETRTPHPPPFSLNSKYLDILLKVRYKHAEKP